MTFDEELSAAARSLHREWKSPQLWPSIAAEIARIEQADRSAENGAIESGAVRRRRWQALAAAAVVVLALGASLLLVRDRTAGSRSASQPAPATGERLLSDQALAEVERAEVQYISAIEALAAKVTSAADASASPMLAHLRERLLVIDIAIADCRAEIERNRFNAHLRRQLLSIYQEKRRTLEQILEQGQHVS